MVEELLEEAEKLNIEIHNDTVEELTPTYPSRIPFQLNCIRYFLWYRLKELAKNSCTHYKNADLLSAITLTRSAIETAALLYNLYKKVFDALENNDIKEIEKFLKRALLGSKNKSTDEIAVHVLSLIDTMDKEVPNFRNSYDALSEYVHPNWAGTMDLFSTIDKNNMKLLIKKMDHENVFKNGLNALIASQRIVILYNGLINDLMDKFLDLCNKSFSENIVSC